MAEQNILVTLYFHTVPGTFNGCTVCHSLSQRFLRTASRDVFRTQNSKKNTKNMTKKHQITHPA